MPPLQSSLSDFSGLVDTNPRLDQGLKQVSRLEASKLPTLDPLQLQLLRQKLTQFGGVDPTAQFQGRLPGAGDLQGQTFNQIGESLTGGSQGGAGAQDFLQSVLQGNAFGADQRQQTIDDFNQFQLPFAQNVQDEQNRLLLESLAGTGGFDSSATLRQLGRSNENFSFGQSKQLGDQLNFDKTQFLNSGLTAADLLQGNEQDLLRLGLAGGEQQRNIGVQQALQEQDIFQRPQDLLAQLLPTLLGTKTFDTVTSRRGRSKSGGIGGAIAGAANLASGVGSLASGLGAFSSAGGVGGLFGRGGGTP